MEFLNEPYVSIKEKHRRAQVRWQAGPISDTHLKQIWMPKTRNLAAKGVETDFQQQIWPIAQVNLLLMHGIPRYGRLSSSQCGMTNILIYYGSADMTGGWSPEA
jgi:hypothetical protein